MHCVAWLNCFFLLSPCESRGCCSHYCPRICWHTVFFHQTYPGWVFLRASNYAWNPQRLPRTHTHTDTHRRRKAARGVASLRSRRGGGEVDGEEERREGGRGGEVMDGRGRIQWKHPHPHHHHTHFFPLYIAQSCDIENRNVRRRCGRAALAVIISWSDAHAAPRFPSPRLILILHLAPSPFLLLICVSVLLAVSSNRIWSLPLFPLICLSVSLPPPLPAPSPRDFVSSLLLPCPLP